MYRALTLSLAFLLMFALSAAAGVIQGTVKAVDPADHSFVLQDGTKISVSDSQLMDLAPGDEVRTSFETRDGQNIAIDIEHRTSGPDGATTNFGTLGGMPIDPVQGD